MYNLGEQFKFNLNKAIANPNCIIKGEKYRISVLSPSLIRLEYSPDGIFNDLPTLNIWYRNFDKPQFETSSQGNQLIIKTNFFNLIYNKEKPFNGGKINPSSNLKVTNLITNKNWYYNYQEIKNYESYVYQNSEKQEVKIKINVLHNKIFVVECS